MSSTRSTIFQPQKTSAARLPRSAAGGSVLLVGPETRAWVSEAGNAGGATREAAWAESFVEAILMAGQGTEYAWIIAGIGSELVHLERAVQSLRSVCSQAHLVVVCQVEDEPMARRALAWGVDDYQILPITLEQILTKGVPERPAGGGGKPNGRGGESPALMLASLPVMMQTSMMDNLLQGRGDLAARGVAILQSYLQWSGKLELLLQEGESDAAAEGAVAAVHYQNKPFGKLALRSEGVASQTMRSQLDQAAQWLGGWLALAQQNEQLRALAITDELSGAYNRRYFQSFVTSLLEKARRERFRVTLLLFDIDNFKTYNDRFGHAAGDAIIRQLIALLRRCTRERDLVARIGGDEFAVVFWDSEAPRQPNSEHPRDAVAATERFRKAICSHNWQDHCRIQGSVSISGGIASFPWDADTLETLLATADAALLKAKSAGKNVILLCGEGKEK